MLATNSSPPEYVKQCRANVDNLVKAYRKVATAAKGDASVATSLMLHDGILTVEKSIKFNPETSVLGLAPGALIVLDEQAFTKLARAYFDEIEAKFT